MYSHHLRVYWGGSTRPHGHVQQVSGGGVGVEDTFFTVHDFVVDFCYARVDDDDTCYIHERPHEPVQETEHQVRQPKCVFSVPAVPIAANAEFHQDVHNEAGQVTLCQVVLVVCGKSFDCEVHEYGVTNDDEVAEQHHQVRC